MKNDDLIIRFEKKYGSCALLKRCVSMINHILVDKHILTVNEFKKYLENELKK